MQILEKQATFVTVSLQLYPRGVEYTFTLVVSFHSLFITKVDKAYRIRCFYMEAEKTVAQQLEVSMLTTHQVNEQFPMPQCRYHIRRGARDGPPVRFARVGEPVYHVWECDARTLEPCPVTKRNSS